MKKVFLVSGKRTPFAKAGTKLQAVPSMELGRHALVSAVHAMGHRPEKLTGVVDEVIVGNVGSPPDAANIGRVVSMRAGFDQSISAYTVHRNCASALEAIAQGFLKISSGVADVIAAGGTESMSNMPLIYNKKSLKFFGAMMKAKTTGKKLKALCSYPFGAFMNPRVAIKEGLTDPFCGLNMGQTAEVVAKDFLINREQQDKYAMESHHKTVTASEAGFFNDEIAEYSVPPKFKDSLSLDVGPRKGQSMEALAKLRPYFDRKHGSVTVGNACPITDGAAMVMLASEEGLKKLDNPKVLAEITNYSFAGLDPKRMGLGPVFATAKLLKKTGQKVSDFGVIELNEAFAAQVIGCLNAFDSDKFAADHLGLSSKLGAIDPSILNPQGGAIAIGHPVGATGARLVLTAALQMNRNNIEHGLATLCIGGGQGGALSLKLVK